MIRAVAGIILLILGIFFALEADSALDSTAIDFGAAFTPNLDIPDWILNNINNPVVDISSSLGANTYSEMDRYLTVFRVLGIVAGVIGLMLVASIIFQRTLKKQ